MSSKKMFIILYVLLYTVPGICSDKNTQKATEQAIQQDSWAGLLTGMSVMLDVGRDAKNKALDDLEKVSKASLCKKAPKNKAEIDDFIQKHRTQNPESQRLQPQHGPMTVKFSIGSADLTFWQDFERLMEPFERKK